VVVPQVDVARADVGPVGIAVGREPASRIGFIGKRLGGVEDDDAALVGGRGGTWLIAKLPGHRRAALRALRLELLH